ncbi:MAG: hypothetical protein RR054_04060 [Clostridia bacterium]
MNYTNKSKSTKLGKQIIVCFVTLLFSISLLGAATYAWISISETVKSNDIGLTTDSQSLKITKCTIVSTQIGISNVDTITTEAVSGLNGITKIPVNIGTLLPTDTMTFTLIIKNISNKNMNIKLSFMQLYASVLRNLPVVTPMIDYDMSYAYKIKINSVSHRSNDTDIFVEDVISFTESFVSDSASLTNTKIPNPNYDANDPIKKNNPENIMIKGNYDIASGITVYSKQEIKIVFTMTFDTTNLTDRMKPNGSTNTTFTPNMLSRGFFQFKELRISNISA